MTESPETKTEQIKKDYRAGAINFVDALYDLRQAGHHPLDARDIVYDLIKEKYNDEEESAK